MGQQVTDQEASGKSGTVLLVKRRRTV